MNNTDQNPSNSREAAEAIPPPGSDDEAIPSDVELVEKARNGDMRAFDQLVTRYRGRVYGMIYNMVRNEADALDLAQDVFVRAWRALPRFEARSSFFTWLYRIAHNVTCDWSRRRRIEGDGEFDDNLAPETIAAGAHTAPSEAQSPDREIAGNETLARIQAALDELSEEHRTVILLKEIEGLKYHEIAETVGCSIGTVMSRLFYARKKLQALLEDIYAGEER